MLSNKQKEVVTKGKNAEIEKWEAELRNSLANKKSNKPPVNLSKQERELIDTQLRKEAEIRRNVDKLLFNFKRGLAFIRHAVNAKSEEFVTYLSVVIRAVLDSLVTPPAVPIHEDIYETFIVSALIMYISLNKIKLTNLQNVGQVCGDRLGSYRTWIGTAVLRCLNASVVPEELKVEPLHGKSPSPRFLKEDNSNSC